MIAAVIAGAVGLPIVARTCAEVARYRFTQGASANTWLIDRYGYDSGMFLDKLLGAGRLLDEDCADRASSRR